MVKEPENIFEKPTVKNQSASSVKKLESRKTFDNFL